MRVARPGSAILAGMKRALDLLLVLLAAPVVAPILAFLALAVLLTDGRPVFFTQTRVGLNRRLFRVFKSGP